MRYSIEGFSQERAVELGLSAEDLVILRWFVDYWPSKNMVKMVQDSKEYGFVKYAGFIEQMPIIGCNRRTIARKFKRLVDSGVLENATIKEGGSYSVYRFGPNYETLVEKSAGVDKNVQPSVQKCATGLDENVQPGMDENVHTNTSTFNNTNQLKTSTYNTSIKAKAERIDYESFQEVYNQFCTKLPECKSLTSKRKKAIQDFLKDFTPDQWREICEKANQSSFLTGSNDRKWKANIDFLLKIDKAAKILEGGYSKEEKKSGPPDDGLYYGVYL